MVPLIDLSNEECSRILMALEYAQMSRAQFRFERKDECSVQYWKAEQDKYHDLSNRFKALLPMKYRNITK